MDGGVSITRISSNMGFHNNLIQTINATRVYTHTHSYTLQTPQRQNQVQLEVAYSVLKPLQRDLGITGKVVVCGAPKCFKANNNAEGPWEVLLHCN